MSDLFTTEEKVTKKVTAKDMEGYLADRYCDSRQWVFLTQVQYSTGGGNRIADAMAFNMYRSNGYEIIGFEIKVSRSDFLSELKDMSKSNEIMEYCDKWYLVVSDASIVKDGELPKDWGLLVLKDGKLVQKVRPVPHKPKPMDCGFIASVLRKGADAVTSIKNQYIPRSEIKDEVEQARKQGYEQGRGYNGKQTEDALKSLREEVLEFEKASGIKFDAWRGKEYFKSLGMYVKVAMDLDAYSIEYGVRNIEGTIKSLEKVVVDMKKIRTVVKEEKQ